MLEGFKKKLLVSQGRSEFVIVVFCDIRGFSKFSTYHESPDIAMFIKRFFINIISNHFPTAKFVKPTGDGLLLIFPYSEQNLNEVSATVIIGCFNAIKAFPTMFESDSMINFETPNKLGFGITRGPACCLYAEDEILDYSGRLLNLAARLNDFARPLGIVIDGNYKLNVIPEKFQNEFAVDKAFVRGITEN